MLKAQFIKKRGHFVVKVDLACPAGQLLALTGPSGSGKTTVIRTLAGLEEPDAGSILFQQEQWYDGKMKLFRKPRERKIGYVFQEHTLFPHLTVYGNVAFACQDEGRICKLLEMLRVDHLAKRKPHQISGGEKQRVALAQALASKPRVLFLDEPFSALDSQTRYRLRFELQKIKQHLDIPIIMVTHDLDEAKQLGDIHICLNQGLVVDCDPSLNPAPAPVLSEPLLI